MDRLSQQAVVSGARVVARRGFALAALLLAAASGCVTTGQLVPNLGDKPAVATVTAVWINRLGERSDLPRAAELIDLSALPETLERLVPT